MSGSFHGAGGDGFWARLRRASAKGVAAAVVAWVLAEATRRGVCGEGGCGLLDAWRSDLVGLVTVAIDLALQCVLAKGKCGSDGRRRPDDEDDGGAGAVGGGSRRNGRRRLRSFGRRGKAPVPADPMAIEGASVGGPRAKQARAPEGVASRRIVLTEWVARVRRTTGS